MVLRTLQQSGVAWCHGYDMSKLTGIKSGTLYPMLARLHEAGWLETRWEDGREPGRPPRHLYRLSGLGSRAADEALRVATAKSANRHAVAGA